MVLARFNEPNEYLKISMRLQKKEQSHIKETIRFHSGVELQISQLNLN